MPLLTADAAVRNLEIQPGAVLDMSTYELTVEDTLVNDGTLIQTISSVPSGEKTEFLNITNASGAQQKYLGVDISPTSGAMGSTTVQISGNAQCTVTDPTDTVDRCFDITPAAQESATIRFYYRSDELDGQDPSAMKAWHWGSGGWSPAGTVDTRDEIDPDMLWIEVSGVSEYSPFALSDKTGGPTVISLRELGVEPSTGLFAAVVLTILILSGAGGLWFSKRKQQI